MTKEQQKREEFKEFVSQEISVPVFPHEAKSILDKAWEIIKEGLVNATINCTLDGDANAWHLEDILNEPDWDDDTAVQEICVKRQAANYLSYDTEEELDLMIESIKKADNNTTLDFVPNVHVWEKMEYAFTVGEFKELIGL